MDTINKIITPEMPSIEADRMLARKTIIELDNEGIWHASAVLNYYKEDANGKIFAKDSNGRLIQGHVGSNDVVASVVNIPQLALAFAGMEAGIVAMDTYAKLEGKYIELNNAFIKCKNIYDFTNSIINVLEDLPNVSTNPEELAIFITNISENKTSFLAIDDPTAFYDSIKNCPLFNVSNFLDRILYCASTAKQYISNIYYVFGILSKMAFSADEINAVIASIDSGITQLDSIYNSIVPIRDAVQIQLDAAIAVAIPIPETVEEGQNE